MSATGMSATNCAECEECREYGGGHSADCSLLTLDEMRRHLDYYYSGYQKQVQAIKAAQAHSQSFAASKVNQAQEARLDWHGRWAILKHENNKLRKANRVVASLHAKIEELQFDIHAEKGRIAQPESCHQREQLANLIDQIAGLAERKCAQEKDLRNEIAELLDTVELCNSEKEHYKERVAKLEDELRNYAVHPASQKRLLADGAW